MDKITEIRKWFSATNRPKWLSHAAEYVVNKKEITSNDIEVLACLCLKEAKGCSIGEEIISLEKLSVDEIDEKIYLQSIRDVEGVDKLAPGKTLDFKGQELVVIHGPNGVGKSGYIRLLKHICGAPYSDSDALASDIYDTSPPEQRAVLSFKKDEVECDPYEWGENSGVCFDLRNVQFFDSVFGRIFINKGGKTIYELPLLSLFTDVIGICDKVKVNLQEIEKKQTKTDMLIDESLVNLEEIQWYLQIDKETKMSEVEAYCSFSTEDKSKIEFLKDKPNENDIIKECEKKQTQKNYIDNFIQNFKKIQNELSDKICEEIVQKKIEYKKLEEAANVSNKDAIDKSLLAGVGSEQWKNMWLAAEKYFKEKAYKDSDYSNMFEGELCVLCQQKLEPVKDSFKSFEFFVFGEMQTEAEKIKKEYLQNINEVENIDIPTVEHLNTTIKLIGIDKEEIHSKIHASFTQLRERRDKLSEMEAVDSIISIEKEPQWVIEISKTSKELDGAIAGFKEMLKDPNVKKTTDDLNSLLAKQFLSNNRESVVEKIKRKRKLFIIQKAITNTDTTQLSRESGKLAEKLITEDFQNRFRQELDKLGADDIKVEIVKKNASKGEVTHGIKFHGPTQGHIKGIQISKILSEGENRIVSIAAFLADASGKLGWSPFVFDDPISSLDEKFEEKVAERLVDLSDDRQIIIFTHRLSLVFNLDEFAKIRNKKLNIVKIGTDYLGRTGVPASMPAVNQKITPALNDMVDARYKKALKHYEHGDDESGDNALVCMCVDFRILLERCIEDELLSGIVKRFQRDIHSKKLRECRGIFLADCIVLDRMMSKYSKYLHYPSIRGPSYELPKLDAFFKDVNELKKWRDEYIKRPAVMTNSSQA